MRLGRTYRDRTDIQLVRQLLRVLRRTRAAGEHGHPYIQVTPDFRSPQKLIKRAEVAQFLHRNAEQSWTHWTWLKSANQGYLVALKDNITTAGLHTTCGSRILDSFAPQTPSTVAQLLARAGMIIMGKTNMDEFGMGSHSLNSAYGKVANGSDPDFALSAGGSSGGSALAVAANLAHISIGTDTGGSVRLPAAYMSLVGFKPSYGLISRYGIIPYAHSLDTVGIFASNIDDVLHTLGESVAFFGLPQPTNCRTDILSKPDPKDPTCLSLASRSRIQDAKARRNAANAPGHVRYSVTSPSHFPVRQNTHKSEAENAIKRQRSSQRDTVRRVGVPREYNIKEMHPLVRWAWVATLSHLESRGCEIVPISLPSTKHALSAYYVLAPAEASSNLAKYDGIRYGNTRKSVPDDVPSGDLFAGYRSANFGPEVKRRILLGTYSLSADAMDNYFIQAQKIRRLVQEDFNKVFVMAHPFAADADAEAHRDNGDGVDVIVVPTAPTPPPRIKYAQEASSVRTYMNDVFTVPASLAGLPAVSVPGPEHPDHPWRAENATGIQVIGQYGDDFNVLGFAKAFLSNFHDPTHMERLQQNKTMD